MSAPDTMKATLLDAKTEAAALRIRVRQLEEKLVDAAAVSEREADALRQGADVLVTENARLVAANTRQAEEATAAQCAANEALFTARSRGESLANAIAANTRLREECDALRSLLSRVERLTGVGPPSRPGKPTPGSTWYDLLVQVNALVRGSRERAISPESQPDPAPAVTGTPSDNPSIRQLDWSVRAGDPCDLCAVKVSAACMPCQFKGCEAHMCEHNQTCPVEMDLGRG